MKKVISSLLAVTALWMTSNAQNLATTPDGANPLSFSIDGKTLTAKLIGNTTTGYSWSCKIDDESVITKTSDQYVANSDSETPTMGAGGIHTFVFEGAKKGSTKITFTYKRPWETDGAGVRMLKVKYTGSKIKASEVKK